MDEPKIKGLVAACVILAFIVICTVGMVVVSRQLHLHHHHGEGRGKSEEVVGGSGGVLMANELAVETSNENIGSGDNEKSGNWFWAKKMHKHKGQPHNGIKTKSLAPVPRISSILKAGDEHLYTSKFFNTWAAAGYVGEVTLDMVADAFAGVLSTRGKGRSSEYSHDIKKFIEGSSKSWKKRSPPGSPVGDNRRSIDLAEKGLYRHNLHRRGSRIGGRPKKAGSGDGFNSVIPGYLPGTSNPGWMNDMHASWSDNGMMDVSASELVGLAITFGVKPKFVDEHDGFESVRDDEMERGAFGITMMASTAPPSSPSGTPNDGKVRERRYNVLLYQHKLHTSQLAPLGATPGFSTLFAKHLPASSIPFSFDASGDVVNSIFVNKSTLESVRHGRCLRITHSDSLATPETRFLQGLPSSRRTHFHTLVVKEGTASTSTPLLIHAIAALPFNGGLTPLASMSLVKTVAFVASGGLEPARLLQRLDALVDKVNRHISSASPPTSPIVPHHSNGHSSPFGPLFDPINVGKLVRVNDKLAKLATNPARTGSKKQKESLLDKTARMARYTTLIDILISLIPGTLDNEAKLCVVRDTVKRDFERSYVDAVAAYNNPTSYITGSPNAIPTSQFRNICESPGIVTPVTSASEQNVSRNSMQSLVTSGRPSSTFPQQNLGRLMESLLKEDMPLGVESVALVIRMVVVAWTVSVQGVVWDDGEESDNDDGVRIDVRGLGL